jgi:hypothetical protein
MKMSGPCPLGTAAVILSAKASKGTASVVTFTPLVACAVLYAATNFSRAVFSSPR